MAGFPKPKPAKRPKPGVRFDKNVILTLIRKEYGNVSRIADTIGTSRGSMRQYLDRNPDLLEAVKQERERQLDELEKHVFDRATSERDTALQAFLLKTQGKSRGYDQSEAQHSAKEIAEAAFAFILDQSKNPAEPKRKSAPSKRKPRK